MTLPVLNVAKRKITVPILGTEYTIRPYLVGEEKALYMALESKDEKTIVEAVKNIITSCVVENIVIDDLSSFEIEYLFLQLRKISVNNIVEIGIRHQHSKECNHAQKIEINLDDILYEGRTDNKIILDKENTIGVVLRPPTMRTISKKYASETEQMFGIVISSIESIFDAEQVYYTKDISEKELTNWINQFSNEQFKLITDYIQNLPSMYYHVSYTCSACGETENRKIEGITNFL